MQTESSQKIENATNICSRLNEIGKEDVLSRDFRVKPLDRKGCQSTLGAECSNFMFSPPWSLQPEQSLLTKQEISCRGETAQPKVDLKPM